MKSFSEWLQIIERAEIHRNTIPIDEDDIAYLQQLPSRYWNSAFQKRYGELLLNAIDGFGEIRPDWNDRQKLVFIDGGVRGGNEIRKYSFTINTGIKNVIRKLREAGVDLRGVNDVNKSALYFNLMKKGTAVQKMNQLRAATEGRTAPRTYKSDEGATWENLQNPDIQPNIINWRPVGNLRTRSDFEPTEKEGMFRWDQIKGTVEKEAVAVVQRYLKSASEPTHWAHINYLWWKQPQNFQQMVEELIKYVWHNLKDPAFQDPTTRKQKMYNFVLSKLQQGYIGRNVLKRHLSQGVDFNQMLYQKDPDTGKLYTPEKLTQMAYGAMPAPQQSQAMAAGGG